jgi:hypothetical protein
MATNIPVYHTHIPILINLSSNSTLLVQFFILKMASKLNEIPYGCLFWEREG